MNYKVLSNIVIEACLLLLMGACQQAPRVVPVSYKQDFPIDTAVSVKTFPHGSDLAQPNSIWRIGNDRVLVSGSYDEVGIFSYPDWNYIRKMTLPHVCYYYYDTDTCLYLESGGNVDVWVLRDDSLYKSSSFFINKVPTTINAVQELSPGVYIYPDNKNYPGMYEFHIMDTNHRKCVSKGSYPEDNSRFKRLKDFKQAYWHYVRVKPDKSAFAVVYTSLSRIRIYNAEGEMQQDVFIEGPLGNYKVVPTRSAEWYCHFYGVIATDNYIYLLNEDRPSSIPVALKNNIMVLDWQGNLIARYRLDVSIRHFFVDEQRNMICGTCWKEGEGIVFFTMDILHKI